MNDRKVLLKAIASSAVLFTTATSIVACGSGKTDPVEVSSPSRSSYESVAPSETDATSPGAPESQVALSAEMEDKARNAAVAVAEWHSAYSEEALMNAYLNGEISPELAETIEPVWAEIYDPKIFTVFGVEANLDDMWVNDAVGEEGARTFRVAVQLEYKIQWARVSGGAGGEPPKLAIWWLTMDEQSGEVTKIDQPTKNELDVDKGE